ncbi:MAG TPA: HD-GYP domain-containing protein [Candidatus Dormibacteraeota bacterium]|nr:HD-GYP domain-containing protein [Candidatus Dormibacteraeota bacterium]
MTARTTDAYIAATVAAAAIAAGTALARFDPSQIDLLAFVLLAALAGVAQRVPVYLFKSSAVSVAYVATIATYVLYGTPAALVVNLASAAVNAFTPRRKPLRKILFNTASVTLAAAAAGATYELLGEIPPLHILPTIAAVAVSGLVYFGVSSASTAFVIALSTGGHPFAVWRENYSWMTVNYAATAVIGAMLALAYRSLGVLGAAAFVLPLGVAWYSFRLYMANSTALRHRNDELEQVNEALRRGTTGPEAANASGVRALIDAIETKDEMRRGHAVATAALAVSLGRRLGLAGDELAQLELAALVHDIGRIGVSERVLLKADWLTEEEWSEVKRHPIIGANLLAHVEPLAALGPIVLAHHERIDGKGYPYGAKGGEIPFAARIIAVADAYQAMISPRSHRPAFSAQSALEEICAGAGERFDPLVVRALLDIVATRAPETARVAIRV